MYTQTRRYDYGTVADEASAQSWRDLGRYWERRGFKTSRGPYVGTRNNIIVISSSNTILVGQPAVESIFVAGAKAGSSLHFTTSVAHHLIGLGFGHHDFFLVITCVVRCNRSPSTLANSFSLSERAWCWRNMTLFARLWSATEESIPIYYNLATPASLPYLSFLRVPQAPLNPRGIQEIQQL